MSFVIHEVRVTSAEVNPDEYDGQELEYEIDHGTCEARGDDCIVEGIVTDLGLRSALFGVWGEENRPKVEVKTYRVRGWTQKYDIPGNPIEYDAGIQEVDDDEVT